MKGFLLGRDCPAGRYGGDVDEQDWDASVDPAFAATSQPDKSQIFCHSNAAVLLPWQRMLWRRELDSQQEHLAPISLSTYTDSLEKVVKGTQNQSINSLHYRFLFTIAGVSCTRRIIACPRAVATFPCLFRVNSI